MTVPWRGLADFEELVHGAKQRLHGRVSMVTGNGVVECLPQPLDVIDPRVVGGSEEQLEFRIVREPAPRDMTLVNDVVVDDEHDAPRPAVSEGQAL